MLRSAAFLICNRSRYQLEYQQAQDVLDGRPPRAHSLPVDEPERAALRTSLVLLARFAAAQRAERLQVTSCDLFFFGRLELQEAGKAAVCCPATQRRNLCVCLAAAH
jgi:hypothetical protein